MAKKQVNADLLDEESTGLIIAGCLNPRRYIVISTALGEIHFISVKNTTHLTTHTKLLPGLTWDNHMSII